MCKPRGWNKKIKIEQKERCQSASQRLGPHPRRSTHPPKAISAKSELYLFACCLPNIYAISKTTPESSLNAQPCGCNSINERSAPSSTPHRLVLCVCVQWNGPVWVCICVRQPQLPQQPLWLNDWLTTAGFCKGMVYLLGEQPLEKHRIPRIHHLFSSCAVAFIEPSFATASSCVLRKFLNCQHVNCLLVR